MSWAGRSGLGRSRSRPTGQRGERPAARERSGGQTAAVQSVDSLEHDGAPSASPVALTGRVTRAGLDTTLLLLLVGIAGLGPLAMTGVLPATSAVMADLGSSYGAAQLVLTVFLVAAFVCQTALGRAADHYGRKPVMTASLVTFAIGSALCAVASSIETLLAARFLQGVGGAVCMFLPRTIVRDVYPEDRAASVIGYVTTAMMIAPMFGPALGGWITERGDWRWMYAGLAALGALLALFAQCFQRETLGAFVRGNAPSSAAGAGTAVGTGRAWHAGGSSASELLAEPTFRALALVLVGSVGVYYSFLAGAPFIAMESRGMGAASYGRWFASAAIGYLAGNLFAGCFSTLLGTRRMITLGCAVLLFGVALSVALSGCTEPAALFGPMLIVALSNGMTLPNVSSALMSVRPASAGTASGLAGSLQTGSGVGLTVLIGMLLPLSDGWLFAALSLCAVATLVGIAMHPCRN